MTSLLGRLLPLFAGTRRVEDLFTEAVARLFERRPQLCLSWLDSLELTTSLPEEEQRYIRVTTQKSFVALDEHGSGSRPDLILEVHHALEHTELESSKDVVMLESKIGSVEGEDQLKRYAGHLNGMSVMRKTLVYITRAYDPNLPLFADGGERRTRRGGNGVYGGTGHGEELPLINHGSHGTFWGTQSVRTLR